MASKKYEIVTVGRRSEFPERNNARYSVITGEPRYKVGEKFQSGDYEIEVVFIKEIK